MSIPAFYPGATQLNNGVGTGSWNGSGPWKLLLHTTESRGLPGYEGGKVAPHITWNPVTGRWYQHFPFTRPSEALTAVDNDMVIQVEMICYSAKWIADGLSPPGLWVGNLSDSQLNQLAGFCRWVMGHLNIPPVWPKKQAFTAGTANAPGFRMSLEVFKAWSGLLGHQHAPYPNDHWDPGAFPWTRFMSLLEPEAPEMPLNQVERRVVDIAFDLLGAQGDRNYWYQKENNDPEFETLLKPAMQQGALNLKAGLKLPATELVKIVRT